MKTVSPFIGYSDPDITQTTLCPEHTLFAAILVQAVQDALGHGQTDRHLKAQARLWLGLDLDKWCPVYQEEPVIAFEEACEILDLCPVSVHRALKVLDGSKYQLKRRKIVTKLGELLGWD